MTKRCSEEELGCEFCNAVYDDWNSGGAHDFRLNGSSLFYFDPVFGWEGIGIKFCPMCGRELGHLRDLNSHSGGTNNEADY